jgi:undecaprenyl phosphate-alpha-L-ara4FN deformylase
VFIIPPGGKTVKLGLRIDVDTYRGTRLGVPALCDTLAKHDVKGTFFFSVGPDNMGRHIRRLLKPAFLIKMLRSNAASLYGWDILLRGVFFPGAVIGKKLAGPIRRAAADGHEMGLHAWDHHAWQAKIDSMDDAELYEHLKRGTDLLTGIIGAAPTCSAAPGWKANDKMLLQKERFPFRYNSDCRGDSAFVPVVNGLRLKQPQLPVTLPTYDEVIGSNGISNDNYNEFILSKVRADRLNVLTIHAEVEGIVCKGLFDDFLCQARNKNIDIVPLRLLLEPDALPDGGIEPRVLPGREGWIAFQKTLSV